MKLGQQAFFYHSNCKEPGIVALVKVSVCVLGRRDKEWVIKQLTACVSAPKSAGVVQ